MRRVTSLYQVFYSANAFNQEIGGWNVAQLTSFSYVFAGSSFNRDIGLWNVASATALDHMFSSTPAFNQNIASWNVASVANFFSMFHSAGATFNHNIGAWNLSSATDLRYMFSSGARWVASAVGSTCTVACSSNSLTCSELSWPTSATAVSAAIYQVGYSCSSTYFTGDSGASAPYLYYSSYNGYAYYYCYGYTASSTRCSASTSSSYYRLCACVGTSAAFNQNIGMWNVARVANLYGMLHGAGGFDQNLGSWNVGRVSNLAAALDFASGLATCNKRAMYMGWGSALQYWYPTWGSIICVTAVPSTAMPITATPRYHFNTFHPHGPPFCCDMLAHLSRNSARSKAGRARMGGGACACHLTVRCDEQWGVGVCRFTDLAIAARRFRARRCLARRHQGMQRTHSA